MILIYLLVSSILTIIYSIPSLNFNTPSIPYTSPPFYTPIQQYNYVIQFSHNCDHPHLFFKSSNGATICAHDAYNNHPLTFTCNFNPSPQYYTIEIIPYTGSGNCTWGINLLNIFYLNCTNVKSNITNCTNCNIFHSCISCDTGYVLYQNSCYLFPPHCLTLNYTSRDCSLCDTGYTLYQNSCYLLPPHCLTLNYSSTNCSLCQTGYALYQNICYLLPPHCLTLNYSSTNCTLCQSGYVLYQNRCYLLPPHCLTLNYTSINCTLCQTGYVLYQNNCYLLPPHCLTLNYTFLNCTFCESGYILYQNSCYLLPPHCLTLNYTSTNCTSCETGYALQPSTFLCKLCAQIYPNAKYVTGVCINESHCLTAINLANGMSVCKYCEKVKYYTPNNQGQCVCIAGFNELYRTNTSQTYCQQVCGDGKVFQLPCDDGNNLNNDGCSDACQVESQFTCSPTPVSSLSSDKISICKLNKNLRFKLQYTQKVQGQNKGIIHLSILNPSIKFEYLLSYFKTFPTLNHLIDLQINRSRQMSIQQIKLNQKGQFQIYFSYNKTVEQQYLLMDFLFLPNAKYSSQQHVLHIQLRGLNYPLIISSYYDALQKISFWAFYFTIAAYFVCLLFLTSKKFITVQTINTLQLTFYSLLLIYENSSWIEAFSTLIPLKQSTGINSLFYDIVTNRLNSNKQSNNILNLQKEQFNKYRYLKMDDSFLLNNFANSLFLLILWILFVCMYFKKKKKQKKLLLIVKQHDQKRKQQQKLHKLSEIYKKCYQITFNFSYITILQTIISLYLQVSYCKVFSNYLLQILNKFSSFITSTIIILTVAQNYNHFFLSPQEYRQQKFTFIKKQRKYRRVYFINLFVNAIVMFLLNNHITFAGMHMSIYLFIVQVGYLIFLIIYKPYQSYLKIHGIGIVWNQITFLLALGFVCVKNIVPQQEKIPQIYYLVFAYVILSFCVIVLILAVVRFYFQFKYGEDHHNKIVKKQIKMLKQREEKQIALNNKKNNKKLSHKLFQRTDSYIYDPLNYFLYKNQKNQDDKNFYLQQLQNKDHLNKLQKDDLYYHFFDSKPLQWIKKNQPKQNYKQALEKQNNQKFNQVQTKLRIQRKLQKQNNEQYQNELKTVKQKLKQNSNNRSYNKKAEIKQRQKYNPYKYI